MVDVSSFPSSDLPPHLKCQILSFIRVEWWWVFQGKNQFWDYTIKDTHPVNVIIHEQDVIISHVEVNWRMLTHKAKSYKVYGLSAVFTYPAFRKQGFGKQAVQAATDYIQQSDADIAMLFCLPHLKGFYEACGWTYMQNTSTLYGNPDIPEQDDEVILLMSFVSNTAKQDRNQFDDTSIYVGKYTW